MKGALQALAWLPLTLPGLLPGGPVELEPLPAPDEGHTLALGEGLALVLPTPGRVFAAFGGAEPRLAALGGAKSLAWVLPLAAAPTDLETLGPGFAALGDEDGGVYLVRGDGSVPFAGGLPGGGSVRLAAAEVGTGEERRTVLACLGRESWALLDPADPDGSPPLSLPLPPTSPPALIGETLLYGAGETVVALAEGGELWRHRTGGSLVLRGEVLGGMVYFACGDNRLYGFSSDNPAAPLVEYHELGAPPSALYPLSGGALAVGTVDGGLVFFRDGAAAERVDLGLTPRPGAVLRGGELVVPVSWDRLLALDLADTPFDAEEPGGEPVTVGWVFRAEAGIHGEAALFAPPEGLRLSGSQRSRLAVYLVARDGRLIVLARGRKL
jgi:hypothetical protein